MQFAGIRFFLAGLITLPFAARKANLVNEIMNNSRIIITITLLQTVLQYSFFNFGINMVPAALGAIVIGSQPLFIAFIAHFYAKNDKLTWRKLLIFLSGFTGIVFVSTERGQFISAGEAKISGIILLIMDNVVASFANIVISRDGNEIQPLVLSSLAMFFGGVILTLISIPLEGLHFGIKPIEYYASLLWLCLVSATAVPIWFALLKRPGVKVSDLNFWKFIMPVTGVILSWMILADEKPGIVPLIGMVIVTLSLVLLNVYKSRRIKKRIKRFIDHTV